MKKISFVTIFTFAFCFLSRAQFIEPSQKENVPANYIKQKSTVSGWYDYGDAIYSLGGNTSYYRSPLFPDSTVLVEYSSGMGSNWQHSTGQILDPTSYYHEVNGNTQLNPDNHYMLDSVGIFYRYWRPQQGVPDTLVVQIYEEATMSMSLDPWSNGKSYATVDYDYQTRLGTNNVAEYVYLLENKDTISSTQGFLVFPVGHYVPSGEKIGVTFTYIPGNSFNVGDTIDPYSTVPPTNKINAFYYYYYVDQDATSDPGYYNNQVLASTSIRYNTNSNGWNGSYIPGTAWNSGIYHSDITFHITSDNVGIEHHALNYHANLFPNPVNNNTILSLDLDKKEYLHIDLYEVTGKKVKTIKQQIFTRGNHQITIETSDLSKGLYYCVISNETKKNTIKFSKL